MCAYRLFEFVFPFCLFFYLQLLFERITKHINQTFPEQKEDPTLNKWVKHIVVSAFRMRIVLLRTVKHWATHWPTYWTFWEDKFEWLSLYMNNRFKSLRNSFFICLGQLLIILCFVPDVYMKHIRVNGHMIT